MFLLGHIGITLGIIYLLAFFIYSNKKDARSKAKGKLPLDFRIIIFAAILPDIVDKVVGMMILKEEISNGRLFTHSIIITGIIGICVLNLAQIKIPRIKTLIYILPVYIHLILDRLWENPSTFLWPLLGFGYERLDIEFGDYFTILVSNPYVFIGEIIGAAILVIIFFRVQLYKRDNLKEAIQTGSLGS
jgi:hypothetical protein